MPCKTAPSTISASSDAPILENITRNICWAGSAPDRFVAAKKGWVEVSWDVPEGTPFSAACRIALPVTPQPFWCIPGVFWGDNQQDTTGQYYPRFQAKVEKPRRFESAFWEMHVWRAAQPLAALYDGGAWWVLEVAPESGNMVASVGFEFEDGRPFLIASLPFRERPYRNAGHDYTMPVETVSTEAVRRRVHWQVRAFRLEGRRGALLNFLQENYHSQKDAAGKAPGADLALATRNALLRWHYHPDDHYFRYTVAFDRVGQQIAEAAGCSLDRHEMGMGWVSGWVVFEALVEYAVKREDPAALQAVEETWQTLMNAGLLAPSGYWWTRFAPFRKGRTSSFDSRQANGMDGNWMPDPNHLHLRTLGDAVWRAVRCLRRQGSHLSFARSLEKQVIDQATQMASLAQRGWPLPLSIDARTGEPAGLNGTASMIWISVWSELAAMGLWEDTVLIADALEYYRSAVESGQLYGAPEDVGECLTSEDIYIALNAYLDGYKITQCPKDLETATEAARWLYLWRKAFNHTFDPRTLLGVYDLKSRGADLASFKNNHLHIYGLDADESLLTLAKLTGDARWRNLAEDHYRFAAQLTPQVDGQFNAFEGMVTEQFYFIDWSALGNSVHLFEEDDRRSAYDAGPHYRNHGNLAGFSHAWCTAFVLRSALRREPHQSA